MKIEVSFIYPDKEEGDFVGEYYIHKNNVDWSNISIKEVTEMKNRIDKFELPNGEILDIESGCYDRNFSINVRQKNQLLAQLISSGSGNLAFPTLSGGTVSFEMYYENRENA